jgi:diguanylate cyclase (GGDEF)-like protein/PAS domain S-box-containing protein
MSVSLRALLLIPFMVEVVGITSLMGYLSYRSGQAAVEDLAQQLILETGERVTQNLDYYFGTAEDIVAENKAAIELGILDWQNISKIEDYFVHELQIHTPISSLFFVTESADFLSVSRNSPSRLTIYNHKHLQGNINSYIADIDGNYLYHQNLSAIDDSLLEFQAQTSWYEATKSFEKGIWLTTFTLAPSNRPALLLAKLEPFSNPQGNVRGVVSATFFLDQVGKFLQELKISNHGQVFIVDKQGFLVASSATEPLLNPNMLIGIGSISSPEKWRLAALNSSDPVTRAAAAWSLEQTSKMSELQNSAPTKIDILRESYFVYEVPFTVDNQVVWKVVIAIPEADFTTAIQANTRKTILLCGFSLIGALIFGLEVIRRVMRPLKQLDQATQQYAAEGMFQASQRTGVKEVDYLWQSFERMTRTLGLQKAQMETIHADYARSLEAEVATKTQAFQTSEARLRQALDISGAVAWEHDLQTHDIVFTSTPALEMPQSMTYAQAMAQVHPDDLELLLQANEDAIAQKGTFTIEHRVIAPDHPSGLRWFQVHARVVTDANDTPTGIVGMSVDVTDRKILELALQASEAQLTNVLNSAQATIIKSRMFLNGTYVFDYVSKHCEVIYGFSAETLTANPQLWQAHILPQDWQHVVLPLLEQIQETRSKGFWVKTYRYNHPDGSLRWILAHISACWNASENQWELAVVENDITELKQAEMAVRISEAKFSTIFHDNPAPAWIAKLEDGYCMNVNQSFCNFLGYSASEVLGHSCSEIRLWDNEADLHQLRRQLQKNGAAKNFETIWRTKSREAKTVLLATRVAEFDGETCVIGVANDITNRKLTEVKLQQLSQELFRWRDRYELATWAGRQIIYEYNTFKDKYTWGRNTQEILGYRLEEMPQTLEEWTGFIHPSDQQLFTELATTRFSSSEPYRLEFRVRKQDGSYLWIEDQGVPQLNDQGKLVKAIGAVKDVSDLKQAEAERNHMLEVLKQSEANYLAILDDQTEIIARFQADGTVLFVNEAFYKYYNVPKEQVIGKKYQPYIHPDDQPAIDRCLASLSPENPVAIVQNRVFVGDEARWMEWTNRAIYDDGDHLVELQAVGRDIHYQKQAEAAIRESQAKFQRLVDDIGEKFVVFSHTIPGNIMTYVSGGIKSVFGLDKGEVLGKPWQSLVNWLPQDLAIAEEIDAAMVEKQLDFKQFEMRFVHPDGELRTVSISQHLGRDGQGNLLAIEGILEDITERKQAEQELKQLNSQLEKLATQDSLTNIANRRKMEEVLGREWQRCQRDSQPLTLILLDIDHFKPYNDNYGHPKGDWCLKQVAKVLEACAKRPGDLVARYGGEEFLLILPTTNKTGATSITKQIQASIDALNIPHSYSLVSDKITVSLGIAVMDPVTNGLNYNDAISLADQALYQAKKVRNTYHIEIIEEFD